MTTCFILDDELHAIKLLSGYIEKTPGLHLTGFSQNPLIALSELQQQGYPQIIFTDIDMPGINGIAFSEIVKNKTSVVFTTAYPKYALEAFEKDAFDYLVKPITYERFVKCINKVKERINPKVEAISKEDYFYIQCEAKGNLTKINYNDVVAIEGMKNYVTIITEQEKFVTYLTMKELEERLPASLFTRVHKSFIVNIQKIHNLNGNLLTMSNDKEVTIGNGYKEHLFQIIKDKLIKSNR